MRPAPGESKAQAQPPASPGEGDSRAWIAILTLLTAAVIGFYFAVPELAVPYWYLICVPVVASAARFGLRGAVTSASAGAFALFAALVVVGGAVAQTDRLFDQLILAAGSMDEARALALRVSRVRAAEPLAAAGNVFLGYSIAVIGGLIIGWIVDERNRVSAALQDALRLRSYVSPQVIDVVSRRATDGGSPSYSARREVTLLFSDLRDFTALSERTEPEEIVGMLNEYLAKMTDAIVEYEGTLDKYIGDGIMAFFGDPVWTPDHAERAVRAALTMQARFTQLQSRWAAEGHPVGGMGIGISTGYATIGNVGSPVLMGYTAIGGTVNVAARLSEIALAGQILTTPRTYWRVQQSINGDFRDPVRVKGFPHPVEIVEITGLRAAARAPGPGIDERFVDLVSRVVNDPTYRAVLLTSSDDAGQSGGDEDQSLARAVAVLCGYPTFQNAPAEEMAELIANGSLESYGPGSIIVHQGAVEEKFYVILKGEVVVTAVDASNRPVHIASLGRGDYFGEVALLFDAPRMATVRTVAETRLLVLHRDAFYAVLPNTPVLKEKIEAAARQRAAAPQPNAVE